MQFPHRFRVVLALAAVLFAHGAGAQTVVRVLHYNIHRDIGGTDSNVASQPALAKVVNHLAPDVWAMNELGGKSTSFNATTARNTLVAFINANLTIFGPNPQENVNYFLYIGEAIPGQADIYIRNAIVSRWPFLATQTYSDANAAAGFPMAMRGLVSAHVNLPGPVELGVFTTHLKASSFSDTNTVSTTNAGKRQAEADTDAVNLQNWLAAHVGDAAVMAGDWNETEEPGETDNWKAGAIGDVLPNGSVYHPVTTLRNAGFTDPLPLSIAGNRATIDAVSPDARFDYLFYRASHLIHLNGQVFDTKQHSAAQLAALNAASGTNFVAGDSASASDHLPLLGVFLVSPGAPYILSQTTSGIDSTTAGLNAAINPNGSATAWSVELGTTTAYGLGSVSQTLAAGTASANAGLNVAGLAPGTTYHFRVVAQNGSGGSAGADQTFTTAAFIDSDGDGIPNGWETANSLNANLASDALLDADGDGVRNRDEYAAGTNPRDAASALRITSVARAGADVAISWPSVFGKRYQVQKCAGLVAGNWTVVQTNIAGTGAPLSITDAAAGQCFYRIATLP